MSERKFRCHYNLTCFLVSFVAFDSPLMDDTSLRDATALHRFSMSPQVKRFGKDLYFALNGLGCMIDEFIILKRC